MSASVPRDLVPGAAPAPPASASPFRSPPARARAVDGRCGRGPCLAEFRWAALASASCSRSRAAHLLADPTGRTGAGGCPSSPSDRRPPPGARRAVARRRRRSAGRSAPSWCSSPSRPGGCRPADPRVARSAGPSSSSPDLRGADPRFHHRRRDPRCLVRTVFSSTTRRNPGIRCSTRPPSTSSSGRRSPS